MIPLYKYCDSPASDRIYGEALEPPIWRPCDNPDCYNKIRDGEEFYEHDGMKICDACARKYAFKLFLQQAKRKVAE